MSEAERAYGARGRFHRLRRYTLRLLGVSYGDQNLLFDSHRHVLCTSRHAVQQAGERYREGNPNVILAEVAQALVANRIGKEVPGGRGRKAKGNAVCAWTEDKSKIYVMRRVRRGWVVVTALPTEASEAAAEARAEKGALARTRQPTVVALAFADAARRAEGSALSGPPEEDAK